MTERLEHDLIIIGGGINAAGIARDASIRGLRVLVVEKHDFAKGASGANTGMIHGGIRYLRYDVETTKLSCIDSGYIQHIAPHLLFRIPFLFPVRKNDKGGLFLLEGAEIFFEAYDKYQPLKNGKFHTRLTKAEALALEPGLAHDILGAVTMDEWGINPARLTIENIIDAVDHGAVVKTHHDLREIIKSTSGAIQGVRIFDRITQIERVHRAPILINATGAWGPSIAAMAGAHYALRPGKGVHIVFSHRISNYGIVMNGVDGRQMFLMPHEHGSIVGTTDDDYYGDLDHPKSTEDEVRYILEAARTIFPSIEQYRRSRTYVGIRPTLYAWAKNEDRLSREHAIYDHSNQGVDGLYSIAGGKLASYRLLAEEATSLICQRLHKTHPCQTHLIPLPGARELSESQKSFFKEHQPLLHPLAYERVLTRQGTRTFHVVNTIHHSTSLSASACPCESTTYAEIQHAAATEHVRCLSDIRRRTRCGMGSCGGMHCILPASSVVATVLQQPAPQQLIDASYFNLGRTLGKHHVLDEPNSANLEMTALQLNTSTMLDYWATLASEELSASTASSTHSFTQKLPANVTIQQPLPLTVTLPPSVVNNTDTALIAQLAKLPPPHPV